MRRYILLIVLSIASTIVAMAQNNDYRPIDDGTFAAAQAHAVSAMITGISNYPVFMFGLVAAAILYCLKLPVMTFGLGVYLPFYLSATAFIGGALRFIVDKFLPNFEKESKGQIIASGVLGGEGVVGVVIAIIVAVKAIA